MADIHHHKAIGRKEIVVRNIRCNVQLGTGRQRRGDVPATASAHNGHTAERLLQGLGMANYL